MRLVFIRHPETQANVARRIYGRTESDYSPAGAESVGWVVEQLSGMKFHRIYASPLKRTSYLAGKIAEGQGHGPENVILCDDLIEMDMGLFEDLTGEEAKDRYPEEFKNFIEHNSTYRLPEGESFEIVQERAVHFIKNLVKEMNEEGETEMAESDELIGERDDRSDIGVAKALEERKEGNPVDRIEREGSNDEKNILIVSHSMVIRGILAWMLNMSLDDIWHIDIKPASITEVLYKYDYAMLRSLKSPTER